MNVAASTGYTKPADTSVAQTAIASFRPVAIRTPADFAVCRSRSVPSDGHLPPSGAGAYLVPDRSNYPLKRMCSAAWSNGRSVGHRSVQWSILFRQAAWLQQIIDNTFMIAAMINGNPEPDDIRKYFRALRRAQRDFTPIITETNSLSFFVSIWTHGAGDPASESSSSRTAKRCLSDHSTGLSIDLRARRNGPATTNRRSSRRG